MFVDECVSKDLLYYNNQGVRVPGCHICRFNRKCNLSIYGHSSKVPKGNLVQKAEMDLEPNDTPDIDEEDQIEAEDNDYGDD
jgi:hypothetical protein